MCGRPNERLGVYESALASHWTKGMIACLDIDYCWVAWFLGGIFSGPAQDSVVKVRPAWAQPEDGCRVCVQALLGFLPCCRWAYAAIGSFWTLLDWIWRTQFKYAGVDAADLAGTRGFFHAMLKRSWCVGTPAALSAFGREAFPPTAYLCLLTLGCWARRMK